MTQLLLDTHTFIWYLKDDPKLGSEISNLLEDPDNDLFISFASLWEIAIKINIGKLNLGCNFSELFLFSDRVGIRLLSLTQSDLESYISLPLHHRDPFDRMIIIQALNRSLIVVSRDVIFDAYLVHRLWL